MTRLVILGKQGAGKGTQCALLVEHYGIPHISTGDILRAAVAEGTELGLKAKEVMEAGDLVSDDLILGIVEARLAQPDVNEGFLLDGFPRTVPQAEALEPLLEDLQQPIQAVVLLELDDAVLIQRLLARGRADDNESVIRNRLEVYREKTSPLISFYQDKGLLISVPAEGSVEAITERITSKLS